MNDELQQQLMEFVYGLLDDADANALCERITSDPQAARAYATVKLQCDLVAKAARYEAPTVAWQRPDEALSSSASIQPASNLAPSSVYRTLANWCVGVAACGLIGLVGAAYIMSAFTEQTETTSVALASAEPVQVVLTGPSKLHAEAGNPFTIQVENEAGTPVSTTLNYSLFDTNGAMSWQDSTATDAAGIARFTVADELARNASRLEVSSTDESPATIVRELEASPEEFVTYLRMDRPLYQPGELVLYRSVTLSRYGLRADREVTTSFEVVNDSDKPLAGSAAIVETERGVASGTFTLPNDLPDGKYTLLARSPDNLFRDEWRDFQVRRFAAPRLLAKLELGKDSYTLGERVDLDFSVKRAAGEPLAEQPLQIEATLDGLSLSTPDVKTNDEGKSQFSLTLPESIERGEASVSVTVQEGEAPAETITKNIPINLGKVNVDFYPEGGELAAGLPNRVYFFGRDPLGKPAHLEGRIVDSNDKEIAEVVTAHEGRGVFSFTPAPNEQYRLIADKPVDVTKAIPLPAASADRFAAINTGDGVFDANAPITFTLYQRTPLKGLIVAAYCRGAMVAQRTIERDDYDTDQSQGATYLGQLDLPAEAQGVIRLTVFDAALAPPQPIAERLVYRRVGQKLDVRLTPDANTFAPGQSVQIDLAVRDERDAPVSAALGIAIVDDAVLNLADDKSVRMPTYFHLLTELDSPEQLEDANFYLSDEPEAVAALDSLLGTQGWRRFEDLPATRLAGADGLGFGGGGFGASFRDRGMSQRYRAVTWAENSSVPVSTATTMNVQAILKRQSSRSASAAARGRTSFALPMIVAGLMALTLVGLASFPRVRSNRSLRIFACVCAATVLVLGVRNLPKQSIRVGHATDMAAPVTSGAITGAAGDVESAKAENEFYSLHEEGEMLQANQRRSRADDVAAPFDAPMAASSSEPEPSSQLEAAPEGAARFAAPREEMGRSAGLNADKKALDLNKEKEVPPPAPRALSPKDAAPPSSPQRSVDMLERPKSLAEESKLLANREARLGLTRKYAEWFYDAQSSASPNQQPSSTLFWIPLFVADGAGTASLYFDLPERPSSFRAIVEAHGANRLGAGELLINSR